MRKTLLALLFTFPLWAAEIYATFDVIPSQEANLALTVSGVVKTLRADVGDSVKKGSILLEIDNNDLSAGIELAKESLKKAQIEEQFARQTYERYKKVESVIDAELMALQALVFQKAQAVVGEARAQLRYKNALIEKTRLRAPFSGVISQRNIELGDGVGGNTLPLFRLISSNNVKLILKFDEKYLSQIKKGASVRYRVDGETTFRNGVIRKIYPSVDPKTRKATAEILASNIASGLFGEAYILGK